MSYVQLYAFRWLDGGGGIIEEAIPFTSFAGGTGEWAEVTATGLVAPAGAQTALIEILGNTGAVPGATAQGEVLIDDFTLVSAATGPAVEEAVLNGDFEILDFNDPFCSESWICDGTQTPQNVVPLDGAFDGIAAMELRVENDAAALPNSSEIRQDIAAAGGTITPGTSYDFSFQAKQLSSGVSYVQQYRLQWLNEAGAPLPGGIDFTNFTAGPEWTEIRVNGLMAPAEADTAVIQVIASTGAVAGAIAEGAVLIDAVSLGASIPPTILPASSEPGLQITWGTEEGSTYQLQRSLDLQDFTDFGPPIMGDGRMWSAVDSITNAQQFYQVVESAP